jgi:hypothetical protein
LSSTVYSKTKNQKMSLMRDRESRALDGPESAPSQAWTYCLDSHNVIRPGPCANPTNDTLLQVKMTSDRQIFKSMELVTAEIPMPDFLNCELRVQRDLHLPLCEEDRTLRLLDGSERVLPPTWNRVDYEGDGVYRTENAHRLDCGAGYAWLWGGSDPVLLCHQDGRMSQRVCVLSPHTFRVDSHNRDDALYVWSTPLTWPQVAHWAGVPLGDPLESNIEPVRLPGYVSTPLYRRLTGCPDMEMVCQVPCIKREAPIAALREALETSSNTTHLHTRSSIRITDYCGCELVCLKLKEGHFNPDGLCTELSRGHVFAYIECDRLCFRSDNGEPFTVQFTGCSHDGTFFGFASSELHGRTFYGADKALCWDLPPIDWNVFDCCKLSMARAPVTAHGRIESDTICFGDSHGFRTNDAVIITVGDESRLTRVVCAKLHSIDVDRPHGWRHKDRSCFVKTFPAPLFLFGAGCNPVLGCLTPSHNGGWVSRFPVDLRGPTYVMMQIVDPVGSAQCEHVGADGTASGYIGKCVFMSIFRTLHEPAPRVMRFFSGRRVTEIHVRLLNPDGTLYELHGMHWSATFLFKT